MSKNPVTANDVDHSVTYIGRKMTRTEQLKSNETQTVAKFHAGKNSQNTSDLSMRKLEKEEIRIPYVTRELSQQIIQSRVAKGWKQEELATRAGLAKEVIRDYENGKAIAKQAEISRISRALGVALTKPKAQKVPDS